MRVVRGAVDWKAMLSPATAPDRQVQAAQAYEDLAPLGHPVLAFQGQLR